LQVLQFNEIGSYGITTRNPENFSGCDFAQQIQKENYPSAILQVPGLGLHISFVFYLLPQSHSVELRRNVAQFSHP
jgi:hypothetical protein